MSSSPSDFDWKRFSDPLYQCSKYRLGESIGEGLKSNLSTTSTENIIISQDLKKIQNTHFFQFFKHVKQQQHQINTLLHKYENTTNK